MDTDFLAGIVRSDDACLLPEAEAALRMTMIFNGEEQSLPRRKRSRVWEIRPRIEDPDGLLRSLRSCRSGPGMRRCFGD